MVPASGQGAASGRIGAVTATLAFGSGTLNLSAHRAAAARAEIFARQLPTGSSVAVGGRSATLSPDDQFRLKSRVPFGAQLSRRLVRDGPRSGQARRPARELASARLFVSPHVCHRPMLTSDAASPEFRPSQAAIPPSPGRYTAPSS